MQRNLIKTMDYSPRACNEYLCINFHCACISCLNVCAGVQEIADWVGGHEQQLVWVYVNDEGADHDWGHQELITAPVRELLGDLLFTPSDKEQLFPHSWWGTCTCMWNGM